MSTQPESVRDGAPPAAHAERRLYRSNSQRVFAGICAGLGDYFAVDPVWFRVGFVILALGGGSGFLIYLLMWLIVPPSPDGYTPPETGRGSVTGAAVVGVVFMVVGTIALVNTVAPWLGQYIWPIVFVLGGLALLLGGLNRDSH
ncbi:MAG TPA: PspC domain-containing protein [Acidimicrobiia bacterium]|nr:PspC domain-containing protein [Acidimicrobiia bacterium]